MAGAALATGALLPASADTASAVPCYSADCVPNVARNVVAGGPCEPLPRRLYAYGLEPGGATVICSAAGVWEPTGPLIGVYNVALSCPALNLSAQGSDGIALQCLENGFTRLRWAHRTDM
ncbi:hypothetical protein A5651_05800 [Mycobacterium sp. 1274761.0]|nr:hypothetical protein A5651_05800 [Mycobacterium sp. 1274761.0]